MKTTIGTRTFYKDYWNILDANDQVDGEAYVTPKEALKRKEFYMLWVTRSQNLPFPLNPKIP